jgi:hypothetical protein
LLFEKKKSIWKSTDQKRALVMTTWKLFYLLCDVGHDLKTSSLNKSNIQLFLDEFFDACSIWLNFQISCHKLYRWFSRCYLRQFPYCARFHVLSLIFCVSREGKISTNSTDGSSFTWRSFSILFSFWKEQNHFKTVHWLIIQL